MEVVNKKEKVRWTLPSYLMIPVQMGTYGSNIGGSSIKGATIFNGFNEKGWINVNVLA